nr:e3 sumo-protein ligase nse2 [Quercus suber]
MPRLRQSTREPAPPASQVLDPSSQGLGVPTHEAPIFTLTADAQRAIQRLKDGQQIKKLLANLKVARENIQTTACDINESLAEQERVEKKMKERNAAAGQDVDEQLQQRIEELRNKVERMTQRMDEGMRKIIDGQNSIQHIFDSVDVTAARAREIASTQASQQQRQSTNRRRGARDADGSDEEDEEDGNGEEIEDFEPTAPGTQEHISALDVFKKQVDDAKTRYQTASLTERYAANDDYRNFRRLVHDSRYGDEGPPLAPESQWFNEGGAPAPGVTHASAEEESDDDIAVSRATISTRCPLTLQEFKTPLTSKKCPHSFEKDAITQMIRASSNRIGGHEVQRGLTVGGVQAVMCPVPGCGEMLTADDLHEDQVIKRKIQRLQRAKEIMEADDDDEEDDGVPGGSQRNATILDDDDDDDVVDETDSDVRPQVQTKMKQEKASGRIPPSSTMRSALDEDPDGDSVMFDT